MSDEWIVLTGARKNAGDFLITEQSILLLKEFVKNFKYKIFDRQYNFDNDKKGLETINNSKGIILLGGPSVRQRIYPDMYTLINDIDKIKVPIIPLGIGFYNKTTNFENIINFKFDKSSTKFLNKLKENKYISVRDIWAKYIFNKHGLNNVVLTQCASLFNLDYQKIKFKINPAINTIYFTPANNTKLENDSIHLMKIIKNLFKDNHLICGFHRDVNKKIENEAKKLNFEVVELNNKSLDLEYDYHVGYRVHAHLNMLSKKKPSLLIHEDSRGKSISTSLNLTGADSMKEAIILLKQDLDSNFIRYIGYERFIQYNFIVMKEYIKEMIK